MSGVAPAVIRGAVARASMARLACVVAAQLAGEHGRLAPWLAVTMGGGVLAYFVLRAEPPAWVAAPAPALALLAVLAATRSLLAGWGLGLLAAAWLGFGAAMLHARAAAPMPELPFGALVVSGIVQNVDLLPEGRRVTLAAFRLGPGEPEQPRTIRLRLRANDPARPEPGDGLAVRALLRGPSAPAYPGAWDFQRAAYFAGQGGAGFAIAPAEVTPRAGAAPPLAGVRAAMEGRVTAAIPGAAGAVAAALLTGGQSAIPRADITAMRDSGLAHLLSVSGLHIAIVMGVAFWVVRFLIALCRPLALRVDGKVLAGLGALGAGGFYMLLTGAQVPMQRSFAMAVLVTLALLAGRQAISMRSLALAAAAVLLLAPAELLGPSFQMSFAAVLALIAGWEAMRAPLARLRGDGNWWRRGAVMVVGVIGTSVLAGLATGPVGLAHFGRLQWYGVAANAVAVPLTSALVMPSGMLAALLMSFGLDAPALAVMGWGVEGVLAVARSVAAWPGAAEGAPPIPGWGLALYGLGLCWLCLWRSGWRWIGLPLLAIGVASPALHRPPDALMSADARLIAFMTGEGMWIERRRGASAFIRNQWLRGVAAPEAVPLPGEGEAASGAIACDAAACTLRESVVMLRGGSAEGFCGRVAVILSPEPVRGRCRGSVVVDRFSVWRDGAHAVRLGRAGAEVMSDRTYRGARPWVPPVPEPGGWSRLPVAPVE